MPFFFPYYSSKLKKDYLVTMLEICTGPVELWTTTTEEDSFKKRDKKIFPRKFSVMIR